MAEARDGDVAAPIRWGYALLVGLPLVVLNAGWIAYSEMRTGVTEITITTLFIAVVFHLFVLTLLNGAVRRLFGPRLALSQAEMMVLYAMLSLGTAVAGIGNLGFFLPFLTAPFWYGEPDTHRWHEFLPYLPPSIGPRRREVLKRFHEGRASFFEPEVVAAWAFPLAYWVVFLLLLLWTMLCMAAIVRRRWTEEEQLPFPVVALPLEMTRDGAPLYRDRLMWLGFALPFFLHSLNSLNSLYPSLPSLPINTAKQLLVGVQYPWTGFGSLQFLLHPAGVGFGFLVNADVLFSLWFFFAVRKLLNLYGTMMNWRDPGPANWSDGSPQFPFSGFQAWGAWLTIGVAAVITGWPYFRAYFRRALEGDPEGVDRGESMSARLAVFGLLGGFLALCAMVWALGASWWVPVAFLGLYLLLMLAISRIEAETAVLSPQVGWVDPQNILAGVLGVRSISKPDLAHISALSWFNIDYRAAPMPQQLQAMVGLKRAGVPSLRPLTPVLMLAAFVGVASSLFWGLQMYHENGAATANVNAYRINMGNSVWWRLSGWFSDPKPPEPNALYGMAFGSGFTLLLTWLRVRFAGFPLAPSGYVLNMSQANELFWFDLFVAWVFKATVLRYGGIKAYRTVLPFFLGLVLGDFVTGATWSLFGTVFGLTLFRTFPN
ncbi:MAG TPA: DUF6785 family protein [Armatimonadaceae bacterium]|nr:DUF6785 family protein [Armatimonadaceae bacterium]